MVLELLKFVFIFDIFLYNLCCVTITNWSGSSNLENEYLLQNIGQFTTPSLITCAAKCSTNLTCMSYSYRAGNSTCLLYPIPIIDDEMQGINSQGWKSYNLWSDICPSALGYWYNRNLKMCYRLETDAKNITDAILFCSSYTGHMLRINTLQKQIHIVALLMPLIPRSVYIGGFSESRNDIFLYEDGTPLTFFAWYPDNPNGETTIKLKKNFEYKWGNAKGNQKRSFLCEITV